MRKMPLAIVRSPCFQRLAFAAEPPDAVSCTVSSRTEAGRACRQGQGADDVRGSAYRAKALKARRLVNKRLAAGSRSTGHRRDRYCACAARVGHGSSSLNRGTPGAARFLILSQALREPGRYGASASRHAVFGPALRNPACPPSERRSVFPARIQTDFPRRRFRPCHCGTLVVTTLTGAP